MGTARDELTALLGESLFRTRKNFGMFGQIHISIRDVTPQWLSVGISTSHSLEGASVALSVRNAVLNWLQDLLPVERFIVEYRNPTLGITGEVHDMPYADELPKAGQLRSAEILVEEIAGPAREELRPRFRVAWQRFVEEESR